MERSSHSLVVDERVDEPRVGMRGSPASWRSIRGVGPRIRGLGDALSQWGLVLVLVWIGAMKFTAYEATGISLFVSNSPVLSWLYGFLDVRSFSSALGVGEIAVALLLAFRRFSPGAAVAGGLLAIALFATTLGFLLTTPGVWETSAGGFPALSVVPGQFLLKDVVLIGVSVSALGDALCAGARPEAPVSSER